MFTKFCKRGSPTVDPCQLISSHTTLFSTQIEKTMYMFTNAMLQVKRMKIGEECST